MRSTAAKQGQVEVQALAQSWFPPKSTTYGTTTVSSHRLTLLQYLWRPPRPADGLRRMLENRSQPSPRLRGDGNPAHIDGWDRDSPDRHDEPPPRPKLPIVHESWAMNTPPARRIWSRCGFCNNGLQPDRWRLLRLGVAAAIGCRPTRVVSREKDCGFRVAGRSQRCRNSGEQDF